MASMTVDLVSPERLVYTGEANLVIARTSDGEIGFQPGHVPFVGALVPGEVRVHLTDGGTETIAVHSGFIELADDQLTLLSDVAELSGDIDVERARRSLDVAEEALRADGADAEALAAKRRAEVRLHVAGSAG